MISILFYKQDYVIVKKKKGVANDDIEEAIWDGVPYSTTSLY